MPHPKFWDIVRCHYELGRTVLETAWDVDEEPAVVREVLDDYWNNPQGVRSSKAARGKNKEAVETARKLLAAGYSIEVVRANFYDLVSEEEMAHG